DWEVEHGIRVIGPEPHGPYQETVRRKLAESTDGELLTSAGQRLARRPVGVPLDFDSDALARSCLERALQVDPGAIQSRAELVEMRSQEQAQRVHQLVRPIAPISQYA